MELVSRGAPASKRSRKGTGSARVSSGAASHVSNPIHDDPEAQEQPREEHAANTVEATTTRAARAGPAFVIGAIVVTTWAVLISRDAPTDHTCELTTTNATTVDDPPSSRFAQLLLDELSESCGGCMNVARFAAMYLAPTGVTYTAVLVYAVYIIGKWARRLRDNFLDDDAEDETEDGDDRAGLRARMMSCLRRAGREVAELDDPDDDTSPSSRDRIAYGMSLIYTDGQHVVQAQARVLKLTTVEPSLLRGTANLKIFHDPVSYTHLTLPTKA